MPDEETFETRRDNNNNNDDDNDNVDDSSSSKGKIIKNQWDGVNMMV